MVFIYKMHNAFPGSQTVMFNSNFNLILLQFNCRSSGPVSYGYSELENNNQLSLTNSGEGGLQTPNVEFSSVSIKKEILVSANFLFLETDC